MQYQATAKYIRVSPRKVRLVADAIRTISVPVAVQQLAHMPNHAAKVLKKVIDSAVANARGKNQISQDRLRFFRIEVSGGPAMKRWRAVSKGSAHAYKKRMTHIRVVLTDEEQKQRIDRGQKGEHGTKN